MIGRRRRVGEGEREIGREGDRVIGRRRRVGEGEREIG